MIARYTREPMGQMWSLQNKFQCMLKVEVAVAQAEAEMGLIPKPAAEAIRTHARFDVARIEELEKTTRHDVIAFVSNVAENCGEYGRFVHFGLTSSDVLDTALSLQVAEALQVLEKSLDRLEDALVDKTKRYKDTLCAGRTHGMHAEPTTFGLKMAGYLAELRRNRARLKLAGQNMAIGKLSGAVGTYSALGMEVEEKVCERLGLRPETVATQVIPRDRHAEMMFVLSLIGDHLERLAVELRHLQRTEVGEVCEGFGRGQKGSSAMPHKKNPISAENLTGVARLLRGYQVAASENVALWHERDISHSSVERVAFPDAFILCDYAADRMAQVLEGLVVDEERMLKNIQLSQGQLFSSHVLLALVNKGLSREKAYELVQRLSHSLSESESLKDKLLTDPESQKLITAQELEDIFTGTVHRRNITKIINKLV